MKEVDKTTPKPKTTKRRKKGSLRHLLLQPDEEPLVVPKVIRQYTRKKKESVGSVHNLAGTTSITVAAALSEQNDSVCLVNNHVKIKEEIMVVDVKIESYVETEERSESQKGVGAEDNYVKIEEENIIPNASDSSDKNCKYGKGSNHVEVKENIAGHNDTVRTQLNNNFQIDSNINGDTIKIKTESADTLSNESGMNNDASMNSNLSETVQDTAKIAFKIEPEDDSQYINILEQKHIDGFRTDCLQYEEDIAVKINPKAEKIICNNVNGKADTRYSEKEDVQGQNCQELASILKLQQTLNVAKIQASQKKILITEEIHIKEEAISNTEDYVEVKDETFTSSIEVKDTTSVTTSSTEVKHKNLVTTSSIEEKHNLYNTSITASGNESEDKTPVDSNSIEVKDMTSVTTSSTEIKHKNLVTTSSIEEKHNLNNTSITASGNKSEDKTPVDSKSIEVNNKALVVIKKNRLPEKLKIRRIMNMPKILKTYGRKQTDPVTMKKCFVLAVSYPPAKVLKIVSQKFPKIKSTTNQPPNPKYICDMCSNNFRSKASLSGHMRFNHGVVMKHSCMVCSASFAHHYLMLAHWRAHADPPYECDLCPKSFRSKDKYGEHLNTHLHERLFPCPVCLQRYPVLVHMQRHAEKHTQQDTFSCNICMESYRTLIDLRRHSELDHGLKEEFPCYVCSRILSSSADFITHVKTHDNAFHACAFCPRKFTDAEKWEEHSAEHIEKIGRGESIEKRYSCQYCKKSFEYQSVLKTHIRMHTGERPYECPECKKKLKTQSALTEHVNGHKRPFPCPECKRRFGKRNSLSRHRLLHTGERPHSCTGCSMTFVQRSSMLQHMRRFHEPGLKRVPKNKKGAKKLIKRRIAKE